MQFDAVCREGKNLAVSGDGGQLAGRGEVEAFGLALHRAQRDFIILEVVEDLDADLSAFTARRVEFPQPEILFINYRFAICRDGGEKEIAAGMVCYLDRSTAARGD